MMEMDQALPPAAGGILADAARRFRDGTEESGFMLLKRADEALDWRLALVDSAVESLDIKYFIWHDTEVGNLLFARVLEAAARGVRVRILVDDLNLSATVEELAGLDHHPNLSIRLFNPTRSRSIPGALGEYARGFSEMNRRMHNKVLSADGQLAIIGGRNLSNEYFGLSRKYNFLDLDVLCAGPVVDQIEGAFDDYWSSELALSAGDLAPEAEVLPLADALVKERASYSDSAHLLQQYAAEWRDWTREIADLETRWRTGSATYIQDQPVATGVESERLLDMVETSAPLTQHELTIFSPYLIPDEAFLAAVAAHADRGVWVRIVTGTKAAVNHTAAYAHYEKYLDEILDTGAELYEVDATPEPMVVEAVDVPPIFNVRIALHLKGMVSDRRHCFIGSLNFDPRAVVINTENGLHIDSPELGEQLGDWFDRLLSPANAWHVTRDPSGKLWWDGGDGKRPSSPHRGNLQRVMARFFRILPIESQL